MDNFELNAGSKPCDGLGGGILLVLVTSCYRNWDKPENHMACIHTSLYLLYLGPSLKMFVEYLILQWCMCGLCVYLDLHVGSGKCFSVNYDPAC